MDRLEQLDCAARLVRLQVAHEMPLGAGHERCLCRRLLDPVLAENGDPGRDRGAQAFGGHGLRDRDELDVGRVAAAASARVGDAFEDTRPGSKERGHVR
jgi:hypothetical protein